MLWVKSFHILFVMAWMSGIFYLPRILVHYREAQDQNQGVERIVIMATKLAKFTVIMAILAAIFGFWLVFGYGFTGGWLHAKLALVAVLIAYQVKCWFYIKQMQTNGALPSSVFFRFFNEAALLIATPIILLVVIKPF